MNHKYIMVSTQGLSDKTNGEKPDVYGIIEATAENIASFIVRYKDAPSVSMHTLDDLPFLTTSQGFVFKMYDQAFLTSELLPVLVPMQLGETYPVEIKLLDADSLSDAEPLPVVDYNAYSDYISHDDWPEFRKHLLINHEEEHSAEMEQPSM